MSKTINVFYCDTQSLCFRLGSKRVVINGVSANKVLHPENYGVKAGKFGITQVDADDWDAIVKKYGSMRIFKNGRLHTSKKEADGIAEAKEKASLASGKEQLDPKKAASKPHKEE